MFQNETWGGRYIPQKKNFFKNEIRVPKNTPGRVFRGGGGIQKLVLYWRLLEYDEDEEEGGE